MGDLGRALRSALAGRACVVGVGNSELGDDGFGPCVAEALAAAGHPHVIVADTTPERHMETLVAERYDSVLFLDAVEFGGEVGAAVLLDASEIETHFPQVSTHKLSLGTLARLIRRQTGARVHLLGVRPESLRAGAGLSGPVKDSAGGLMTLLSDVLSAKGAAAHSGVRAEPPPAQAPKCEAP